MERFLARWVERRPPPPRSITDASRADAAAPHGVGVFQLCAPTTVTSVASQLLGLLPRRSQRQGSWRGNRPVCTRIGAPNGSQLTRLPKGSEVVGWLLPCRHTRHGSPRWALVPACGWARLARGIAHRCGLIDRTSGGRLVVARSCRESMGSRPGRPRRTGDRPGSAQQNEDRRPRQQQVQATRRGSPPRGRSQITRPP
jgi:hypothetical protein